MVIIKYDEAITNNLISDMVICIGEFDGFHLGHQTLINKLKEISFNKNLKKGIITFEPHPDLILKKIPNKSFITPFNEKVKLFESLNIDYLIVIPFNTKLMNTSPKDFVINYLMKLNVKEVVVGYDFTFGDGGKGTPEDIELYSLNEIKVTIMPKVQFKGEKIGSSLILDLLKNGKIEEANKLLGHIFHIMGVVIPGNKVGRTINLPTANLSYNKDYAKIKTGVYGVMVIYKNKSYIGLANLGHNPSFNFKDDLSLEIHLLDFSDDLYGEILDVYFISYIREEIKFESKEAFLKQIEIDKIKIRNIVKID